LEASESIPNRSHRVASRKDPHYLPHEPTHHQNGGDEIKEESTKLKKKSSKDKDKEGKKKKHKKEKKHKKDKEGKGGGAAAPVKEVNLLLDSFEERSLTVPGAIGTAIVTSAEQNGSSGENHEAEMGFVEERGDDVVEKKSSKKSKKPKVKKEKKSKKSVVAVDKEEVEEPNLF